MMKYINKIPSFLFGYHRQPTELWDAEILGLPSLIKDKINWYLFDAEGWIKDKKIRLEAYDRISQFLLTIQKDSVKTRSGLRPYLFNYRSTNHHQLREDLRKCGWLPLDPLYDESDEWCNANLILTDASIKQALQSFKIPFNRDWCYCLAEDYLEYM